MQEQLALFDVQPSAFTFPSTRYQGSKQKFVDWIWHCIKDISFESAIDVFGGTGCVAYRLKQEGKRVTYNDILPFNFYIGKALIENTNVLLTDWEITSLINEHSGRVYPHFIEDTFKEIYFTDQENYWLDVVSTNIRLMTNQYKQAIAYFALFQACIIKRPYNLFHRKNLYIRLQDVKRSFGNKTTWDTPFDVLFRKFVNEANEAVFNNGSNCLAINLDCFDVPTIYDLVYIDTPYLNMEGIGIDYADFYHFLNGLIYYDKWSLLIDYNTKNLRLKHGDKSVWNEANSIKDAFGKLFEKFRDNNIIVVSYRSNGIPSIEELLEMLIKQGRKVELFKSCQMKYVLSNKQSNEMLIVAQY